MRERKAVSLAVAQGGLAAELGVPHDLPAPRLHAPPSSPPPSSFFTLGAVHARRRDAASRASYDAKLDAIRAEVRSELGRRRAPKRVAAGRHAARRSRARAAAADASRARMVAEIKQQLQSEMGLLPVHLLRDRRSSFVELYSYDNLGQDQLRHGRLSGQRLLHHREARGRRAQRRGRPAEHARKITSVKVVYRRQGDSGAR